MILDELYAVGCTEGDELHLVRTGSHSDLFKE